MGEQSAGGNTDLRTGHQQTHDTVRIMFVFMYLAWGIIGIICTGRS